MYTVYLLTPRNPTYTHKCSYIGFSINPLHRIRQHNGEILGGAKKTLKLRPWDIVCVITGFTSKTYALQFEWAWQHTSKSKLVRDIALLDQQRGRKECVKRKLGALKAMITNQAVVERYGRLAVHFANDGGFGEYRQAFAPNEVFFNLDWIRHKLRELKGRNKRGMIVDVVNIDDESEDESNDQVDELHEVDELPEVDESRQLKGTNEREMIMDVVDIDDDDESDDQSDESQDSADDVIDLVSPEPKPKSALLQCISISSEDVEEDENRTPRNRIKRWGDLKHADSLAASIAWIQDQM